MWIVFIILGVVILCTLGRKFAKFLMEHMDKSDEKFLFYMLMTRLWK